MARIVIFMAIFWICIPFVWARDVFLKNGDRWSGEVLSEDEHVLRLKTSAAGEVTIDKTYVDMSRTSPPENTVVGPSQTPISRPPVEWSKRISLGYTKTSGNSRRNQVVGSAVVNRKTGQNESTFKFDTLYASSNDSVEAKKFYGMLRYANSFGINLKSYIVYKLEGQQDIFANVEYRLIPSIGLGYWFSDNDDMRAMAELAAGYQYTKYRSGMESEGQPVLLPRVFLDKRIISRLHLTQDLTFYPSLSALNNYRYRSETALINQINDRWGVKIQFINEYDSHPPNDVKKADFTWITSLEYNF